MREANPSPIDFATETLIDLKAACKRPEFKVNGKGPHFSTIFRLMTSGKLESIKVGGKRVTSVEAIQRMIARQNPGVVATVSPRARDAELSRLERELEKAGV